MGIIIGFILKNISIAIFFLCSLFTSFLCSAEDESKIPILWLTDDIADKENYIENNQISIGTDTSNLVLNALTKYQFEFQLAPIPRINLLLKSTENICVGNRVKTKERALNNIFSLPINIYPGLRLYYLNKESGVPKSLLNEDDEINSLAKFFEKQPNKVLGISKGRSFGKYLDDQISQIPKSNIILRGGNGRYEALVYMLLKNRIDFLIDFPTEHKRKVDIAVSITNTHSIVDIKSLAIANSPKLISGRIACTKSAFGKAFIAEVDKILLTLYQEPSFYQAHARYINKSDLPAFKTSFNSYFQRLINQGASR